MPLLFGRGACVATDAIVRNRALVRYMYRDRPASEMDSGWRFYDTPEPALTASAANVYDVTLVASIDPSVADLLDAPEGAAFVRKDPGGPLVPAK
jgi:hypothetical protein